MPVDAVRSDSVVPLRGQVGLVTGGGRGIGDAVARELAAAGMRIAVTGRTEVQVRSVADAVGGLGLIGDVSQQSDVERWVAETERSLGPIDLLVNNAAIVGAPEPFWNHPPSEWWRVFEVNVLGAFLCCHAVAAGMVERRRGRIVNVTSGAGYIRDLPAVGNDTSYPPSKAALTRFTERLAEQLADYGVFAFAVAPGIVRSEMTASLPDTIPWTPPEAPPRLIRGLAEGRADALSGRYLHAEHDADLDALAARADEIHQDDLNVIRLRR
ncbi:MAG TPA: SDR family oxidoreductase [Gaiellales bacterium]|nr:SDR family oxidoreductase [Gaiellales bacterium]